MRTYPTRILELRCSTLRVWINFMTHQTLLSGNLILLDISPPVKLIWCKQWLMITCPSVVFNFNFYLYCQLNTWGFIHNPTKINFLNYFFDWTNEFQIHFIMISSIVHLNIYLTLRISSLIACVMTNQIEIKKRKTENESLIYNHTFLFKK